MLRYLRRRAIIALIGFVLATNPSVQAVAQSALQNIRTGIASASPSPVKLDTVKWASCSATPVELNIDGMPSSAVEEVKIALEAVEEQTGKKFYISKLTSEIPNQNYYTKKTANGYPPVLIAFVNREDSDILSNDQAVAGAVANPSGDKIVTGAIAIDKLAYLSLDSSLTPGLTRITLLVHELGHLLGLKHSKEGIMSPVLNKINSLQYTADEIKNIKPERC